VGLNTDHELSVSEARKAWLRRKWSGYLLTGICLALAIWQISWSLSIATTQMVGVYHRWKIENDRPLTPAIWAVIGSIVVAMLLATDRYSRTDRRILYTALVLAVALAIIGAGIVSLIEPYSNVPRY
jgi:hypothetical protein